MLGNDDYTSRARVAPALIAVSPPVALAVTVIAFTPSEAKVIPIAVAVFTLIAGQLGRDAGESREAALFRDWGGAPTTAMLRPDQKGDGSLSCAMLERRHRQLERLWGGMLTMPTAKQQHADPDGSDRIIADFVSVLRARTRDTAAFPLLAAENVSYGFRRNCLGLRRAAVILAVLTIVAGVTLGGVLGINHSLHAGAAFGVPVGAAVLALAFWYRVTETWVHKAARRYARSLLETLELLDQVQSVERSETAET